MNIAIILASGMGKRMGADKNKVFLELGGKPLIFYTLDNFEQSPDVDEIVIVAKEDEINDMQEIVDEFGFEKVSHIIAGGKERQNSGHNGVKCVRDNYDNEDIIVLFHNGANPFVSEHEIKCVADAAHKNGAAVVAHPTKDTIRKVDNDNISKGVIDRSELWNMQTPQAIQLELALKAFDEAEEKDFIGTDDVSLVEELGGDVIIVEASDNNFKVTTPIDLALAEVILSQK
ncbi:MAG TPA: 2-C-methyl-D-erythritol 4-phosphate cytidylyltransferase [Candidatus Pacebacteria bacterium]|nr:2-C-methyl-D-erythritol 4-phosphate cytidylyltransferase [Candidatus Paceibacterota bacterium]